MENLKVEFAALCSKYGITKAVLIGLPPKPESGIIIACLNTDLNFLEESQWRLEDECHISRQAELGLSPLGLPLTKKAGANGHDLIS